MAEVWEDPRVIAGMRRQLASRAQCLARGERHRGWKVGLNTPAALDAADIAAPLVGFFTDRTTAEDGARVQVAAMGNPLLEPEIAVELRADVHPDGGDDAVRAAIGRLRPAIELVDLDGALLQDVESLLAGDVFHRQMIIGEPPGGGGVPDLSAVSVRPVSGDGEARRPEDPVPVLRHVARYLTAFGEELRAGDIVMTGSIGPPLPAGGARRMSFDFAGLGHVGVHIGEGG